jgi:transcription initiation factor TFIID TATA-box-binding protein
MCTVNLGQRLNLPLIARRVNNAEYNPKKYNPVVLRIHNPRSTANVFASGKLVCTGTCTEDDALKAVRCFVRRISKYCYPHCSPLKLLDFRILNVVCSGSVGNTVRLYEAYSKFPNSIYEPELFPGMKIPILFTEQRKSQNIVALLFHTGKIVIVGAKCVEDANIAYNYVRSKLKTDELLSN